MAAPLCPLSATVTDDTPRDDDSVRVGEVIAPCVKPEGVELKPVALELVEFAEVAAAAIFPGLAHLSEKAPHSFFVIH